MPRAIWKGAISFGLVNVPVALYPATHDDSVNFDWLDKRTLDPVGYKRINKRTGKEIDKEQIVKGVEQDDGTYVVLSDDEIRQAFPKTTQSIELEGFVPEGAVSFLYLERPYYLEPDAKSAKVYALLRDAMAKSSVTGIARIVMHSKEHLAAIIVDDKRLVLNTLRWASEIRDAKAIEADQGKAQSVREAEATMARQLIASMTMTWKPEAYKDSFTAAIQKLIAQKAKSGKSKAVTPLEEAPVASNVIDLTELLKSSLARHPKRAANAAGKAEENDDTKRRPAKKGSAGASVKASAPTKGAPSKSSKSSKSSKATDASATDASVKLKKASKSPGTKTRRKVAGGSRAAERKAA